MKVQIDATIPSWLTSKIFWINVIAAILVAVQYIVKIFPVFLPYELVVAGILNAIAGVLQSNSVAVQKAAVAKLSPPVVKPVSVKV